MNEQLKGWLILILASKRNYINLLIGVLFAFFHNAEICPIDFWNCHVPGTADVCPENHVQRCSTIYHLVMTNIAMENPLSMEVYGWETQRSMGHFPWLGYITTGLFPGRMRCAFGKMLLLMRPAVAVATHLEDDLVPPSDNDCYPLTSLTTSIKA